jgi:hypothetical protein
VWSTSPQRLRLHQHVALLLVQPGSKCLAQGSDWPLYQSNAAPVAGAPAFLSAYSTETDSFISAVSALPASYPGGTDAQTNALGARCFAHHLLPSTHSPACSRGCAG